MKRLFLIILCLMVLCGCENEKSEKSDISSSEISSEPVYEELTVSQELADKYIFEYSLEHGWVTDLGKRNISVSVDDRKFIDENRYSAKLVLNNGVTTLDIPYEGIYDQNGEISFGTILTVDDGTAVFCGKEKVVFFDTNTLEVLNFTPEFPKYEKDNLWVNGACIDGKSGEYLVFVTPLDTFKTDEAATYALRFSKDGSFVSSKETSIRGTSKNFEDTLRPFFFDDAVFFETESESYIMTGYELYLFKSGKILTLNLERTSVKNKNYRFDIENVYGDDESSSYVAILYKDGSPIGLSVFSDENCGDLNLAQSEEGLSLAVSSDEKSIVFKSERFSMILEIDFANNTHSVIFAPNDETVDSDALANSSDGKYSVYKFGEVGVGDVIVSHIAVRNNENGEYIYLDDFGGMYGGYGGVGFLKNNDVYIFSAHSLLIYSPENGEVKFDINKNFPLGYEKESESERGILTFRRDPNDFSFIVVYYEYEGSVTYKDCSRENMTDYYEASFNYKIGYLDKDGNLIESYDTKAPVWSDSFGLHKVDMSYSDGKLTLFTNAFGKGNSGFTGVFDTETKEFTITSYND